MAGLRRKKGGKAGFENPYCGHSTDGQIYYSHTTLSIVISSFPGAGPQCESSEKKEQLILKMLSFFNLDRKVMNIFRSVSENFVIRMTDRLNPKK